MARYITVTPQYNPFSLQELMALPMLYTQAYDKAEEKYNELQDKAAVIRAYAKNSPKASEMLANYDRDMQAVADAIATGRWTANMADKATKLRSYYRDNIIPIQTGITAWEADRQNRQKLGMYAIGPNYSLDDFINNPALAPSYLNGDTIQKHVAQQAAMLAARRPVDSNFRLDKSRNGQYFTSYTGYGYTPEEINEYFKDPSNPKYAEISEIVDSIRKNIDYNNQSAEDKQKIDEYTVNGLSVGLRGNVRQVSSANKGYKKGSSGGRRLGNFHADGGYLDLSDNIISDEDNIEVTYPSYQDDYSNGLYSDYGYNEDDGEDDGEDSSNSKQSQKRLMFDDDPYPHIDDVYKMSDDEYADWLKWYKKKTASLKLYSEAQVAQYLRNLKQMRANIPPNVNDDGSDEDVGNKIPKEMRNFAASYMKRGTKKEQDVLIEGTQGQIDTIRKKLAKYDAIRKELDEKFPYQKVYGAPMMGYGNYAMMKADMESINKEREAYLASKFSKKVQYPIKQILPNGEIEYDKEHPYLQGKTYNEFLAEYRQLKNQYSAYEKFLNKNGKMKSPREIFTTINLNPKTSTRWVVSNLTDDIDKEAPNYKYMQGMREHFKRASLNDNIVGTTRKKYKKLADLKSIGYTTKSLLSPQGISFQAHDSKNNIVTISLNECDSITKEAVGAWLSSIRTTFGNLVNGMTDTEMLTYLNNISPKEFTEWVDVLDDFIIERKRGTKLPSYTSKEIQAIHS